MVAYSPESGPSSVGPGKALGDESRELGIDGEGSCWL